MIGAGSLRGGPITGTLRQLAGWTGGHLLCGNPQAVVCGVAADTRAIVPGDLFVAIRGERTDAHRLLPEAFAAGAVAVLVDRDPGAGWHLSQVPSGAGILQVPAVLPALGRVAVAHLAALHPRPKVVGITGSVGKTTTRELIAAALGAAGPVLNPGSSFNTEITVPLVCLRATVAHRFAAMELAMRGPGQIAYLAEICRPEVGVLTVIGDSHLELLGSREAIAAAKGELLAALPSYGTAILNRDDQIQAAMADWSAAPVLWYGFGKGADVTATNLVPLPDGGYSFTAVVCGRKVAVALPLLGRHQVGNALAALACADACGVDRWAAADALGGVEAAPARLRLVSAGPLRVLDDTFNAAPQSMLAALEALTEIAVEDQRAAVLGDMLELGPAAVEGHRQVGRAAAGAGVSWLLTVGPLAREIALGASEAGLAVSAIHEAPDRAAAIALLPGLLAGTPSGTTVLVKSSHAVGLEEIVSFITEWARARGS